MIIFKKCVLGIIVIGLSLSLVACNNGGSDNNKEGNVSFSNVLNSKKMLPIVVSNSKDDSETGHVVWGGYIGQGKIKAMHLDGMSYDFGYYDLKKLSNKKFNNSLIDMGNDYEPTKSHYVTAKSEVVLDEDKDRKKSEAVTYKFLKKGDGASYAGVKEAINETSFSDIEQKKENEEWATIKSVDNDDEYSGYEMHIKVGKGNNVRLDDINISKKQYKNVKSEDNYIQD